MALTKLYPKDSLVPSHDIDVFWHEHILDTTRYALDCQEFFGSFLHHYPYFGMLGDENKKDWESATLRTAHLWMLNFGEELYRPFEYMGDIIEQAPMKCPQKCPCTRH